MAEKHSVGKAYIQVVPTTDGIKGQLGDLFGAEGSSAGSIFGSNLVSSIKNIMMTAGIGTIIKESLFAGADLQQSLGGVETLFAESAEIVISNAENAYKTAGLSANEYMEQVTSFSASLLQSLEGDTLAASAAADMAVQDMADNANKMGTDMVLIQNAYQGFAKQNYTMLDNLKLGYGGTRSEMERLLADATALSGIEYDIDNLNDVYEAIHVIQTEMKISGLSAEEAADMVSKGLMTEEEAFEAMGTTAKEASQTFSGSFAAMKAAATNVLADLALGEDIGPALDALGDTVFTFVGGNLMPMVGNLLGGLPEIVSGAMTMAIRGMDLAAENADELVRNGLEVAGELVGGILQNTPEFLRAGKELIVSLGIAIWDAAPEAFDAIQNIVGGILGDLLEAGPDIMGRGVSLVADLAAGFMNNAPEVMGAIGSILGDVVLTLIQAAPELLSQGAALIAAILSGIVASIPSVIEGAGQLIGEFCGKFTEIDWWEIGDNIISGIANGIRGGVQSIIDAAWSVAESALDAAKDALGIHSPSTKARDIIGRQIPAGIAVGVEDNAEVLDDAMTALSDDTMDAFRADFPKILKLDIPKIAADDFGLALSDTVERDDSVSQILRLDDYRNTAPVVSGGRDYHIEIHVHAAPGMDEEELADRVMDRIRFEIEKTENEVA